MQKQLLGKVHFTIIDLKTLFLRGHIKTLHIFMDKNTELNQTLTNRKKKYLMIAKKVFLSLCMFLLHLKAYFFDCKLLLQWS